MFHAAEREGREGVLGDEPYWYLYMLCVLPEHQGRGIGSKLLNWGIEAADNAEPPLAVYMEASPIGQKLYERRGFEVVTVVETMEGRLKAPGMKRRAGYAAAGNP
ncbi:hypothetical protein PLICRDRAFT_47223 [Plicaturopsis crispa FD-325 SS-3]|uniref:N-acetyltransferase domain-containing protein n=1 Tax=Plicaturopsis crispa FD-325 SS-3 TaxID=944288 RepID=A0A0C9T5H1_PLICR|nr:hypothetical protein PLICRDRAFT_47223 [Plicaturopsis crispa FD-325 SS-3]